MTYLVSAVFNYKLLHYDNYVNMNHGLRVCTFLLHTYSSLSLSPYSKRGISY